MWKSLVFNAVLFWAVAYLGKKNNVDCLLLAVIFAVLHHFLGKMMTQYEFFNYMPDSRPVPPCPPGSERGGKNGMDCKSMGEKYGL